MFITVHSTVGALLGEQTSSIGLAFFLGMLSHVLFDFIPHGDQDILSNLSYTQRVRRMILISFGDTSLMAITMLGLFSLQVFHSPTTALAGALGGIFPDMLTSLPIFFPVGPLRWLERVNDRVHRALPALEFRQGLVVQICTMAVLLIIIFTR